METQNISLKIPCPIHNTEFIQRVHTDINCEQHLYCLECVLQSEDSSISSKLKTIPDLVNLASEFYARNKQSFNFDSKVPSEFESLVANQGEKLEQLSKHIVNEKKKVSSIFDNILEDTVRLISRKKNEYLNILDQQLFNLRYWYIYFDKQLKKTYPSEDDVPFLFPSKEDLLNKLGKVTNATQLTVLIRNLQEDLNEQKPSNSQNPERNRQTHVLFMSKELIKIENKKPVFREEDDFTISDFKSQLQTQITEFLSDLLTLKNPIIDVLNQNTNGSKIAQSEDFNLINGWLPEGVNWNPKLLYQASKDGFSGSAFHKRCDGKKNTLTLVKAQFNGTSKPCLIGGYLDMAWNSSDNFIQSSNSFLFSTTSKTKCTLISGNELFGGYGGTDQGPTFGGGNDLGLLVPAYNGLSYVNPHSYNGTAKIVENSGYSGNGQAYFTPLEIEVYSLN